MFHALCASGVAEIVFLLFPNSFSSLLRHLLCRCSHLLLARVFFLLFVGDYLCLYIMLTAALLASSVSSRCVLFLLPRRSHTQSSPRSHAISSLCRALVHPPSSCAVPPLRPRRPYTVAIRSRARPRRTYTPRPRMEHHERYTTRA